MEEQLTRRGVLTGMALSAANLLLSRRISGAEVLDTRQGVPALGNAHLLTLVAVSERTLRLRVVQQGKQGPANETGLVPRPWPEPLQESSTGLVKWGEFNIHFEERPWQVTIVDGSGKTRQQLHVEPSTGAIHFSPGTGPVFGLGEGGHPLNRRGTLDAMRNGQHSPDLATYGSRVPIPWVMGGGLGAPAWGIFFAHPWGSFDLS